MECENDRPTAAEILTPKPVTLYRHQSLYDAARVLTERYVSNAPVVEETARGIKLVGFVSERDLMQCYASGEFYRDSTLSVGEVMRLHPICVRPETGIFTLAALFMQHGFRHAPVVSDGLLIGMVSRHDVLVALLKHYESWLAADPEKREVPNLERIFTSLSVVG